MLVYARKLQKINLKILSSWCAISKIDKMDLVNCTLNICIYVCVDVYIYIYKQGRKMEVKNTEDRILQYVRIMF